MLKNPRTSYSCNDVDNGDLSPRSLFILHSSRVAWWGVACASRMGATLEEQKLAYLAGIFHDIGKFRMSSSILLKNGPLTLEEWKKIKEHPLLGAEILEHGEFPREVIDAVRHHHENYNGTGYPYGLKGEEIPLLARIIRVGDAYDAMTSQRPYRSPFSPERAVFELISGMTREFDPDVVKAFLQVRRSSGLLFEKMWPKAAVTCLMSLVYERLDITGGRG